MRANDEWRLNENHFAYLILCVKYLFELNSSRFVPYQKGEKEMPDFAAAMHPSQHQSKPNANRHTTAQIKTETFRLRVLFE